MATEIKNTLFRFVSFRAPELTSDENLNNKFIFRGSEIALGHFDDAITNGDQTMNKWSRLKIASETFSGVITLEQIKNLDTALYKLSVWVSKNRLYYTNDELNKQIKDIKPLTAEIEKQLWDNLFYQVVTQKDFYTKEAIIQLLIANNLVKKYKKADTELSKQLMNARVVLPKELFKNEEITNTQSIAKIDTSVVTTRPIPSAELTKQLNLSYAEELNGAYKKLKSEMVTLERKYNQKVEEDYNLALLEHETKIKPILDKYNAEVEAERVKWCSTKPTDLEYNPLDPCQQPAYVKQPELPVFNFTQPAPFNKTFLKNNLTKESYETLVYLATIKFSDISASTSSRVTPDESFLNDFQNYTDVNEFIDDESGNNNQIIIDNSNSGGNDYVSVGGVLIPVIIVLI